MKEFGKLLTEFENTLEKFNYKNYRKLQEPLSDSEIALFFAELEIDDKNLQHLFKWKNGTNVTRGIANEDNIFFYGTLLSLERIVELRRFDPSEYADLIPIIADVYGDYHLFNREAGPDYGKIYLDSTSLLCFDKQCIIYDSIYSMFQTIIEAYKNAAAKFLENENKLEIDVDKFYEIAKEINKNSNFWYR